MEYDLKVSKFKFQSCYYIHFWNNASWKRYNLPYPPIYELNSITAVWCAIEIKEPNLLPIVWFHLFLSNKNNFNITYPAHSAGAIEYLSAEGVRTFNECPQYGH